jgi:branched-chain amino acid transport system permease protein
VLKEVTSVAGGLSLGGVYALIALGIVLAYRATGTFNFAQGQMMIFGAFFVGQWQASRTLPSELAVGVSVLIVGGIGGLFYLLVLQRTTGHFRFMGFIATLALAIAMDGLIQLLFGTPQYTLRFGWMPSGTIAVLGAPVDQASLATSAFSFTLAFVIAATFRFTNLGRRATAAGRNPLLASQSGIDVRRTYIWSWSIAGALGALAGTIYAMTHVVNNSTTEVALTAFPVLLLGGLDSIGGAILGALIIGLFQSFIATYFDPQLLNVATYALLLVVMLVMPRGLFGSQAVARV